MVHCGFLLDLKGLVLIFAHLELNKDQSKDFVFWTYLPVLAWDNSSKQMLVKGFVSL